MKTKTKLYVPIVSGVEVMMVSLSGLSEEEAARCCVSIFGVRFTGFNDVLQCSQEVREFKLTK